MAGSHRTAGRHRMMPMLMACVILGISLVANAQEQKQQAGPGRVRIDQLPGRPLLLKDRSVELDIAATPGTNGAPGSGFKQFLIRAEPTAVDIDAKLSEVSKGHAVQYIPEVLPSLSSHALAFAQLCKNFLAKIPLFFDYFIVRTLHLAGHMGDNAGRRRADGCSRNQWCGRHLVCSQGYQERQYKCRAGPGAQKTNPNEPCIRRPDAYDDYSAARRHGACREHLRACLARCFGEYGMHPMRHMLIQDKHLVFIYSGTNFQQRSTNFVEDGLAVQYAGIEHVTKPC
jgi:hypothetical protein